MAFNAGDIVAHIKADTTGFSAGIKEAERGVSQLSSKASSLGHTLTSVGKTMTATMTLPILGLGGALIKSAADLEKTATSFKVLVGNGEKANKLFAELKQFADTTPFEFPELAKATTKLLGYGVASEDVLDRLRRLGDAAAASGGDINGVTLAYAQMIGRGKVTGDNLRQLTENFVVLREELSQVTGVPMKDLDKAIESGAVSAEHLNQALDLATNAGGKFAGGTEQLAKTFSGRWSTMKDTVLEFGRNLLGVKVDPELGLQVEEGGTFDKLADLLTTITEKSKQLSDWFNGLSDSQQNLILGAIGLVAALGPLALVIGGVSAAVGVLATPVGMVVLAIGALIAGIIFLQKKFELFNPVIDLVKAAFDKLVIGAKAAWDWFNIHLMPKIQLFIDLIKVHVLPVLEQLWNWMSVQLLNAWNDLKAAIEPYIPLLLTIAKVLGIVAAIIVGVVIVGIIAAIAVFMILIGVFAKVISWIANFGQRLAENFLKGKQMMESFGQSVRDGISSVINWFGKLHEKIKNALSGAVTWLYDAGKNIIEGLINGIKDMAGKAKQAVSDVANGIKDKITGFFGINSPSKMFMGFGENLTQGLAIGIHNGTGAAMGAMNASMAGVAGVGATSVNRTTNFGTVNISKEVDASNLLRQITREDELTGFGLTGVRRA